MILCITLNWSFCEDLLWPFENEKFEFKKVGSSLTVDIFMNSVYVNVCKYGTVNS